LPETAEFVGLAYPAFEAHFTPCVEIGWRLAREHWCKGYATEAARAALDFGFSHLTLDEIISFTVPANRRSRSSSE
jgi:RimJ/RimL family protein N-acetyltransferase